MHISIKDYLKFNLEKRQKHLNPNEPCIERGGNSTNHRGVLAEYLHTPIYGRPADLCHYCGNDACSNPKHLYWGSRKENITDAKRHGTFKSGYDNMINKYGVEKTKEIFRNNALKGSSLGGLANKGIKKSKEHLQKISLANKGKRFVNDGKKNFLINGNELNNYIHNGYYVGMIKRS